MAPAQKDAWREVARGPAAPLPEPVVVEAATAHGTGPSTSTSTSPARWSTATPSRPGRPGHTAFLDTVEALLTNKPWWDTVDSLASHAVGALVARHRELRPRMDAWLAGDDLWLVRSALLHMLGWKTTDAGWLFAACLAWADHPDFFVRRPSAGPCAEYSKVDEHAVVAFVADHEGELSSLSRREALIPRAAPPAPGRSGRLTVCR